MIDLHTFGTQIRRNSSFALEEMALDDRVHCIAIMGGEQAQGIEVHEFLPVLGRYRSITARPDVCCGYGIPVPAEIRLP